jgi:hypothetical protein
MISERLVLQGIFHRKFTCKNLSKKSEFFLKIREIFPDKNLVKKCKNPRDL